MDIVSVRRLRLKEWFAIRSIPAAEKSYLSQLMKGKSPFGEKAARRLEETYQMGSGYLDRFELSPNSEQVNVSHGPQITGKVPLISWVKAGEWHEAEDPYLPGEAEDWLYYARKNGDNVYALRVVGPSMTSSYGKTYPDGCIIFVDPDKRSPVTGDRIIAKLSGVPEVVFKVFMRDAGKVWLKALNPDFPPIHDEFRVIGTVVGKWEDE